MDVVTRTDALSLYRRLMAADADSWAAVAVHGIVMPPVRQPGHPTGRELNARDVVVMGFLRERMDGDEFSAFTQMLEADSLRRRRRTMNRGGGRWVGDPVRHQPSKRPG